MSVINKAIGAWVINRRLSSVVPMFLQLLANMAAISICAITGTVIVIFLITDGLWYANAELLANGVDQKSSSLIIGGILIVLLVATISTAKIYCRKLQVKSQFLFGDACAPSHNISKILNAFVDGFEKI